MHSPEDVIRFWFHDHGARDWFSARPEFDAEVAGHFTETHARAARGEAWRWRATPEGRVAEVIVLDQFSRQLFRGAARAFASDAMALALAQEAVARGDDRALTPDQRMFLYMPYMHSESLVIHEAGMPLFRALGLKDNLKAAEEHLALIRRFGRYPKRNAALNRTSTPEEEVYLSSSGNGMI